jgi:hypothetical protein
MFPKKINNFQKFPKISKKAKKIPKKTVFPKSPKISKKSICNQLRNRFRRVRKNPHMMAPLVPEKHPYDVMAATLL